MKTLCLTLFGSLFIAPFLAYCNSSGLPNSDIFIAKISHNKVISVENITKRSGYDNQPNFSDKGLLYTAAIKRNEQWQTDIMLYDMNAKKTFNLTNTDASEYSPTQIPKSSQFSVIRVGDDSSQERWQYSYNGQSNAIRLRKEAGEIGYHAWGQNKDLITFVLGKPHALYFGNIEKQTGEPVAYDIGRTLAYNQTLDAYSFSQYKDKEQWVTLFNYRDKAFQPIYKLPQGVDYYAWQNDSSLIYAKGSKIYSWKINNQGKASLWLDFTNQCSGMISRLKYQASTQHLAFVCERS